MNMNKIWDEVLLPFLCIVIPFIPVMVIALFTRGGL